MELPSAGGSLLINEEKPGGAGGVSFLSLFFFNPKQFRSGSRESSLRVDKTKGERIR